jgi:hypothetical protein
MTGAVNIKFEVRARCPNPYKTRGSNPHGLGAGSSESHVVQAATAIAKNICGACTPSELLIVGYLSPVAEITRGTLIPLVEETPMVTKPRGGSNQPVFVPACVNEIKPVLLMASIEVLPLTIRSGLAPATPVNPLPSPMNLAADTLPLTVRSPAVVKLGA